MLLGEPCTIPFHHKPQLETYKSHIYCKYCGAIGRKSDARVNSRSPQDKVVIQAFAVRLKELRTSCPHPDREKSDVYMPQFIAAERAGLDRGYWGRLERGESDPTLTSLLRIQSSLEVDSIEALLGQTASRKLGRDLREGEE